MKQDFIRKVLKESIENTELGLAVEAISEQMQSMVEKLTNIKTKDLSNLIKKIKFDGDISKAESFENEVGSKIDSLIQSITEVKGEIDNVSVNLLKGNDISDTSEEPTDETDMDSDFEEFNPDLEEPTDETEEGMEDLSIEELDRVLK